MTGRVTESMPEPRLHADEVDIDASLVERLLAAQFPHWADLSVSRVDSSAGTSNVMYRLGADLAVRLPRTPDAAHGVDKEQRWLPHLAPHLPLAVPEVLGAGVPGEGYPLPWTVCRWLDGHDALTVPLTDPRHAAVELARFVVALRRVDPAGGPPAFRGGSVRERDDHVRDAIRDLSAERALAARAATVAWEDALGLPPWQGEPVWVHSDLIPGNLLARNGKLSAVIDFGAAGIGDPACDTMVAWTMLTAETRPLFRAAVDVDDETWARGRGWALCFGLTAAHYYRVSNPVFAALGRRAMDEALADFHGFRPEPSGP